ncbi:phosphohydrolase [bacterium (Candidatus Torokbacteria) CG_4_10_14_0_2_um_filter_35_8]|nr:MAG: phosphohydrolase [bacterium (Candidatus Torokbacteria) CG_4_10_14_0_2_um_filter_35_8]
MPLTLAQVKKDPYLYQFIEASERYISKLGFTEHGFRHVNLVSDIARNVAERVGFSKHKQELAAIGGYLHDIGNFIGRTQHEYWGVFIAYPRLIELSATPKEIEVISNVISSHEKRGSKIFSKVAAVVVLADKSDVHRSRVEEDINIVELTEDIHNRVNYAVTDSFLEVNIRRERITLKLKIDTNAISVMEYFEIFTERMVYCREAAKFLGYRFGLVINKTRLL